MKSHLRTLFAFAAIGVFTACSGGTRGMELTPSEIAQLRSVGEGDCRVAVTNNTGRRIEVFYQSGLQAYKVRNTINVWPIVGWLDVTEAVLVRAPCDDTQVVIGWRTDIGQALPNISEVVVRQTMREGQVVPLFLRRPSRGACASDNASGAIDGRCLIGNIGGGE